MEVTSAQVQHGSTVIVRPLQGGDLQKIKLISYTDPRARFGNYLPDHERCEFYKSQQQVDNGHIEVSDQAPLGKALLGKQGGEIVTVETPKGKLEWELVEILN